jgi:LysM repeat protein
MATITQYKVVAGDTLSKIAKRYGSTVQAIASASGVADVNRIKVGQVLSIPLPAAAEELPDVVVTPAGVRIESAPKSDPRQQLATGTPPQMSLRDYLAPWFEPPRLYYTVGALALAAWYLLGGGSPRRRK